MAMSEEPSKRLTPQDQLDAATYRLIKLHDYLMEDRQLLVKEASNLSKSVQELSAQLTTFEKLEPQVRQKIIGSIQRAADDMAKTVGKCVGEAATDEINQTAAALKQVVKQATLALGNYQTQVKRNWQKNLLSLATLALSTVAASILIVKLLMPAPVIPLTYDQMEVYSYGLFLKKVWPALPIDVKKTLNRSALKYFKGNLPLYLNQEAKPENDDSSTDS